MNNCVVQAQNVHKSFKDKDVLKGVDLDITPGSVVGLIGKNGAGKTTLLKCILGLLKPQTGRLSLLGEDPWTLSAEAKERLGYVPQEAGLYPWMKVSQVLPYIGAFYPRWNASLVDQLAGDWGLDPKTKVGHLSVGERQKLLIILALGHEPELLILDEPVASLDPIARRDFLRMVLEITADQDRTVFYSTHITSDLERVADHVAILQEGRVVYNDELDKLKDSVKRLHIRSTLAITWEIDIPGMLKSEVDGCDAIITVRDANEALLERIRNDWNATVDVHDMNLEEIFLELHHV